MVWFLTCYSPNLDCRLLDCFWGFIIVLFVAFLVILLESFSSSQYSLNNLDLSTLSMHMRCAAGKTLQGLESLSWSGVISRSSFCFPLIFCIVNHCGEIKLVWNDIKIILFFPTSILHIFNILLLISVTFYQCIIQFHLRSWERNCKIHRRWTRDHKCLRKL